MTTQTLIQTNKNLSEITTMGVGGPAEFFAEVTSLDELREALAFRQKKDLRCIVVGRGSNSLFDDRGYKGLVILNKISFLEKIDSTTIHVGSGYNFSLLGSQTARWGLSGLEFASGIPGSVGGAVFMNAGANGTETCESLQSVDIIDYDGRVASFDRDHMLFSYRYSPFQKMNVVMTSATFKLTEKSEARQTQLEIIRKRQDTQPLKEKSAGCVFRNPSGGHSGALIEQCGLKGVRIGGAEVSPIHANFIVNADHATTQDILDLAELIQKRVKEQTGETLQMEIRAIPYE